MKPTIPVRVGFRRPSVATYEGTLSAELHDAIGVPASHIQYLSIPDTVTVANLHTLVNGYVGVLDPITGAQIDKMIVKITLPFSGAKSAPIAGSEVEKTGLFNFEQAGSFYKFGIDVPAIAASVLNSQGLIDLTNTNIQNWITFLGTVTAGVTFVSKFINALVALLDALISFRKHRKQESRRTIELA
jgi:hypothetical protein